MTDLEEVLRSPWHYVFMHGVGRVGTDGPRSVAVAVQPQYADKQEWRKVAEHIVRVHNESLPSSKKAEVKRNG